MSEQQQKQICEWTDKELLEEYEVLLSSWDSGFPMPLYMQDIAKEMEMREGSVYKFYQKMGMTN